MKKSTSFRLTIDRYGILSHIAEGSSTTETESYSLDSAFDLQSISCCNHQTWKHLHKCGALDLNICPAWQLLDRHARSTLTRVNIELKEKTRKHTGFTSVLKNCAYTSFIGPKFAIDVMNIFTLTAFSNELPAVSSTAARFRRHLSCPDQLQLK